MKRQFIHKSAGNRRLILLFAGWGTDPQFYPAPGVNGYDMMVVWDYTDTSLPLSPLEPYDEIAVVAYSFGVPAASAFLNANPQLPVTARIAVNGTCHPADDLRGIPVAIFRGTLDGLTPASLVKFYRRMAGDAGTYAAIAPLLPAEPDIESLRHELAAIGERGPAVADWDVAFVGVADRIIPPDNQRRAWNEAGVTVREMPWGHTPDFKAILSSVLTDKALVAKQFAKAAATYDSEASVQRRIAASLVERWNPAPGISPDVIEIGCGTGLSTRELLRRVNPRSLRLWDLSPATDAAGTGEVECCDGELRIARQAAASADLIFSTSTMQWFNSPAAFLRHCARVLRKGGRVVVSTFGPETYRKFHEITGIEHAYADCAALRAIVPPEFRVDLLESELITLRFDSAAAMMRHVSATGVNAMGSTARIAATRRILRDYPADGDGGYILTYQPIYMILTRK